MEEQVLSLQQEFYMLAKEIVSSDIYQTMKNYKHHKYTNLYDHSLAVAYEAFLIAKRKNGYNPSVVVRGALLHDFYLYDRFAPRSETKRKGLHGYTHPEVALENAQKHFQVSEKEKNVIESHMWPLTFLHFPKCKEAWLVSKTDKVVCYKESKIKAPLYVFKITKKA